MTASDYRNAADGYQVLADVTQEGEVKALPMGSPFDEMGATGLKRSAGFIDEEFLPALKGTKGVKVYTEMSSNDPIIGSLLFTIEMLLRQVEWPVVGADSSPEQTEAVQFVEECMEDMSHSWGDLIAEVLSCMTYGWAWHEIVYKKRIGPWETDGRRKSKFTDGRIGWRKMPIRAQETLHRWVFDESGGVKGMIQIPPPAYQQVTLSIEKSLLFRMGVHKGNPEGRSILRNAYRPWYFKKRLEEFEAIGVERDLAGLPFAKVPAQMMSPNATPEQKRIFQAFKKLVSNVRRDEHEGVVVPSDADPDTKVPLYDFQLLSSGGARTFDTNALIERYSQAILMTVLADFIMVGHQDGGSYALHVDKTGIFRAALNSVATMVADVFNRHAIPRLFAINQWKLDQLPKIEPSNVDPPNLAELAQFMTSMSGLGMMFFPDPDLEKFLRETAHLPALPEEVEEMKRQQAQQQNAMEFMQTTMGAAGAAQQSEMVGQGMSPEQAQMTSEMPTQEMDDREQALAQQGTEQEQAAAQQKGEMDTQTAQQKLVLEAQAHQQNLGAQQAQGDLKLKQGRQDLDLQSQRAQLELQAQKDKNSQARASNVIDLQAKKDAIKQQRQEGLRDKKNPKDPRNRRPVKKSDNPFRRY